MPSESPLNAIASVRHCALAPRARSATHAHSVIAFHTGGRARAEHRGEVSIEAGHIHIIPAGDAHRVIAATNAEAWALALCRTCLQDTRFAPLVAPLDRVRSGALPVLALAAERQEYVLSLLREIAREQSAPRSLAPTVIEGLVSLVLAEVARASELAWGPAREASPLVAAVLAVIEARCLEPITLRDVADAVGRSPAHVTTAVRRSTGKTVGAWITEGRLAEARRRLRATDERVDTIAERVGYADARHFARVFRAHHGVTPGAYRGASHA